MGMCMSQTIQPVYQKDDVLYKNMHMCLKEVHYTTQHTVVYTCRFSSQCVWYIWRNFGDTVLHVCVPKCACKSVVMISCSQRVCSYGYTQ